MNRSLRAPDAPHGWRKIEPVIFKASSGFGPLNGESRQDLARHSDPRKVEDRKIR